MPKLAEDLYLEIKEDGRRILTFQDYINGNDIVVEFKGEQVYLLQMENYKEVASTPITLTQYMDMLEGVIRKAQP